MNYIFYTGNSLCNYGGCQVQNGQMGWQAETQERANAVQFNSENHNPFCSGQVNLLFYSGLSANWMSQPHHGGPLSLTNLNMN